MAESVEKRIRQNAGLIAEEMMAGPGDQGGDQSEDNADGEDADGDTVEDTAAE